MDAALVARLASGDGWKLLQSLPPYAAGSALALQTRLRSQGHDAALVAAVMHQSELRARAAGLLAGGPPAKLSAEDAARMLLTADGLEQATAPALAARHARRFAGAGVEHVLDLGCGIGADAMALAGAGLDVTAVDADEATAAIAAVNLSHWPRARALKGRAEDWLAAQAPGGAAGGAGPAKTSTTSTTRHTGVWLDPARRTPGVADVRGRTRRVFSLDEISPSWQVVQELAARFPATGAKLSPGMPHAAVPAGCEAQWASVDGEVRECAIWWGPLVHNVGRTALILRGGAASEITQADAEHGDGLVATGLDEVEGTGWVLEADRAVIRAGLTGALVAAVDGIELAPGSGYVVTSDPERTPTWSRRYRIVAAMPLSTKLIRSWLREHGYTRATIKKRGIATSEETLRRELRLDKRAKGSAGAEATLVLSRLGDGQVCLVVEAT